MHAMQTVPGICLRFVVVLTMLATAGCGWMEVRSPGSGRPSVSSTAGVRLPTPTPRPMAEVEPVRPEQVQPLPPLGRVRVAADDTIEAVALRHGVSVAALAAANRLTPPFDLQDGQTLALPTEPEHEVRPGETIFDVARIYGLDPYAVAAQNGLTRPYWVRPGTRLRLPPPSPVPAAVASAAKRPNTPAPPAEREVEGDADGDAAQVVAGLPTALPQSSETGANFGWPVKGRIISAFGAKGGGLHNDGINIAAKRGAPVRAAADGVVAYAGNELRTFGNLILIKHADGWVSAYAHNEELEVGRGARVKKGQVIARVGSSGGVSEPQLHFELRRNKTAVDPLVYLGGGRA
jgi:murein DD-endopeptidase MepM/ murein hydrolase activator NlpD